MSNIQMKHLTFGYADELLFDDAEINMDKSWRLALVGRNGRGKTTLLRLLQERSSDFVYFPQEVAEPGQLTRFALQDLADFEDWKLERELSLLGLDLDCLYRPFADLSGGEQTKCLLALLFLDEGNFPLIDEPTNHLDAKSRAKVAEYLRAKSGFIVVSHDRGFLDKVADHVLAIERQNIQLYQGNYSVYDEEKRRRDDFELAQNKKLTGEIKRLKETASEKRDWAGQRENVAGATFVDKKVAKKQNVRAKSMEKRMSRELAEKEGLLHNIERKVGLEMRALSSHHKLLLQLEDFSLAYDNPLFAPIQAELKAGEILALTGENGAGKSSLLQALLGDFKWQVQGNIKMPEKLKISVVRQLYQNKGSLQDFASEHKLDYELFLNNIRKLGLERRTFAQKIETMSQGQQKKVELAKSLSEPAEIYIWDEPLNHLDLFNREQIIRLIKDFQPSMLIVEHDEQFLEAIGARKICLKAWEI